MVAPGLETVPRRAAPPRRPSRRRIASFPLRRRARRRLRRRLVVDLARGAVLIAVLNLFVLQVSVVRGHSMEPSLHDGDRLIVDRVGGKVLGIHRFDVVVLRSPIDPAVDYVKRVVALPGDRVAIEHGRLLVNGRRVRREFACIPDDASMGPVTVPSGHYFVLGDNRPISCDSREFGFVAAEALRGVVRARFWPLDRIDVFP